MVAQIVKNSHPTLKCLDKINRTNIRPTKIRPNTKVQTNDSPNKKVHLKISYLNNSPNKNV